MNIIVLQCRTATNEEQAFTAQRLMEHTEQAVGAKVTPAPFALLAYEGEKMIGSIIGKIFFNWLHLDLVWVDEAYRGKGMGRELLSAARKQAETMKLTGIETWTQSWQAPEFYKKQGYEEFAVIDDFTPGRKRHAFRLYLEKSA